MVQGATYYLTGCALDCGGRCLLRAEVQDGRVVRIRGEPTAVRKYHLEPCVRGLSYETRAQHPDRLTRPLVRRGPRGTGDFREASWDEALSLVADRLQAIRDESGPGAFLCHGGSGSLGASLHWTKAVSARFFNLFGGHLEMTGNYSNGAAGPASEYTYGSQHTAQSRSDWFRSRLLLLWGWDPLVTVGGSHTTWALRECRRRGIPIVVVDPRRSATAASADHWVPIRPGSDVALLNAMAYELIAHDWHDEAFLQRFALGFDAYRDYLLGTGDGVPKTPEWQEPITGVPAETARWLAREYGTRRPAALLPGWGPQRSRQGEQFHRATAALATIAGYVGVPGGGAAGIGRGPGPQIDRPQLPAPPNPYPGRLPIYRWADCVLRGAAGGYPSRPRVAYVVGANRLGQHPDTAKTARALDSLDFVVVHEHFLTPTARYADVVLPATTFLERNDILKPYGGVGCFYLYQHKAIPPPGQARNDFDVFSDLADRMGFGEVYTEGRDEESWLRWLADQAGIPDFDAFRATGIHWTTAPGPDGDPEGEEPYVPFREQVTREAPFPTPSGKIELYSERLAQRNDPLVPPIPRYLDLPEGPADPSRSIFPLQLLSPKAKRRTNSTLLGGSLDGVQAITLHPEDATARGLAEGTWVRVWNERGACIVPLRVSDNVMPGVATLPSGSWVKWGDDGADMGGCPNSLTSDEGTAWGHSSIQQTVLVEVARAGGAVAAPSLS
ncbi:MAG: molybdopterin-dependent oxidoreductase [Chloroflexi bacterium]|nr:molybdopterin-dependent oxidoreductase [Chloroflexota bacterium]